MRILLSELKDALNAFREALDVGSLALGPYLDSIRDEPRFQAMVAEFDAQVDVLRNRLFEAEAAGYFASLRARAETI